MRLRSERESERGRLKSSGISFSAGFKNKYHCIILIFTAFQVLFQKHRADRKVRALFSHSELSLLSIRDQVKRERERESTTQAREEEIGHLISVGCLR